MSASADFNQPENPYRATAAASLPPVPGESGNPEAALLRAFVGPRSDYFLKKWESRLAWHGGAVGMNWAAFFFGLFWFGYRKMYRAAVTLFGALVVLSVVEDILFELVLKMPEVPVGFSRIENLVIGYFCGAFANSWYLSHARRAIAESQAQGLQGEALLQDLSNRGGTSIFAGLAILLLGIALLFAVAILTAIGIEGLEQGF